jgi:chromosomal replication initiation ATPase DnaA
MSSKFNKKNPEQLIYTNSILEMTALGGIKIDGLDRMRVKLKMKLLKSDIPPVRHNLDLYNDTQLEKFTRKCAEKLEIGTSVLIGSFGELTEQLEQYRLQRQTELAAPVFEKPTLSAKERKQAETFLQTENLMQLTSEKIQASGIVGEQNNALLMFLIFTSRKRYQPLHIVSLGASGMGKTHLQESVGELIPEEDKIEITTLSENAFYYFGQRELKNKLILIEDLYGAENVLYPLRELQSK